jgi:hypothetical protein
MGDVDDYALRESDEPEPPGGREPGGGFPFALIAGLVALLAVGGGGLWLALRKPAVPESGRTRTGASSTLVASPPPPTLPAGMPPLDESDGFVRNLIQRLSSDPRFATWIANQGLVRTFVVAVINVADGESPRAPLAFLAPKDAFTVKGPRDRLVIDPKSYARYDVVADVLASLDAAACASVYRDLEPLLEAGYREQGHPQGGFSKALTQAADMLLATPAVEGPLRVRPVRRPALMYEHEDERLAALKPAQKQLLRMGPRNVEKVQTKLREIVGALGAAQSSTPLHSSTPHPNPPPVGGGER